MSKFLLFTAVLLISTAIESNSRESLNLEELREIFTFRDVRNGILYIVKSAEELCHGNNTQIDVDTVTNEITSRLQKVLREQNQTICELIQNKFAWVVEPLREQYLINCSKVLQSGPAYVESIVLSVSDTICKMEGQQLIELLNPCLNIKKIDCLAPHPGKIFAKHWLADKNHTIKKESCQMYNEHRPCIKNQLKRNCKLVEAQDAFLTILDAAFKKIC